jgi:hypothetical protein
MGNLVVFSLNWLAHLCYMAGRSRWMKTSLFFGCMFAFGTLIWARTERSGDFTVNTLTSTFTKSELVNHYVQATGNLLSDGAYDVKVPLLGIFKQNVRFVPMSIPGSNQSLLVLDEGLPNATDLTKPITLVGRVLIGRDGYPSYYLKVMSPPSSIFLDTVAWVCLIFIGAIFTSVTINSQVRRMDYAISMPFDKVHAISRLPEPIQPFVLWFGSLGAGYGDVVLRQIPVTFRAIPAEARLVPASYPDLWAVMVRRLNAVHYTTVATAYGALPAMRIEFEDERGLPRKGLVAASSITVMTQVFEVLHFVGQL